MSLENPFDKMKSREEGERERERSLFSRKSNHGRHALNDLEKRSSLDLD